jgi:hypothetical protein
VGNRLCRNSSGAFVITGLSEAVRKQVLTITPSVDEAVGFVLSDEVERHNIKHE